MNQHSNDSMPAAMLASTTPQSRSDRQTSALARVAKRFIPWTSTLVVVTGLAWAINEMSPQRHRVQAAEPATVAVASNPWSGASFPVENFQAYTSPFGYRSDPYGGSRRFHYGLDMAAPSGSYIRNWWSGRVVEVSDGTSCGTSITISSGDWTHIYCHMQGHVASDSRGRYLIDRDGGIQIWEGQELSAGARIGRVGMTGRTTGPHLHWGLKYQQSWIDPALVLQAMYNSQRAAMNPAP